MIRKYHNHKLQTNPWHCEEESHTNQETPGRQTKQSNQLKMIAILKKKSSNVQQNRTITTPFIRITLCIAMETMHFGLHEKIPYGCKVDIFTNRLTPSFNFLFFT